MSSIEPGQMVCIEFSTRAGRSVRLLGCLSEATEEHLMVDALEGSTLRPGVGASVSLSTIVGRSVQQSSTTVLVSGDPRRLLLRRPLALLEGNRRRHERIGVRVAIEWFEVERGPSAVRSGHTLNLSVGGALLDTTGEEVAVGERLVMIVQLLDRHVAGVAEARSCRTEPSGGLRMGVQFLALADLDRAAIAHLTA